MTFGPRLVCHSVPALNVPNRVGFHPIMCPTDWLFSMGILHYKQNIQKMVVHNLNRLYKSTAQVR